jgi:hypothetical protein
MTSVIAPSWVDEPNQRCNSGLVPSTPSQIG